MTRRVTVLPRKLDISAREGEDLLAVLRRAGLAPDAPCGGEGRCGKCRVRVDGEEKLACRTVVDRDLTVTLPVSGEQRILTGGLAPGGIGAGCRLAFDIGTTTVVGWLMKNGRELACVSAGNPQTAFGADVVTRIRHAVKEGMEPQTRAIRDCLESLTLRLCAAGGVEPGDVELVSVVGNPAMRQIFLGIGVENLAKIPFAPVLTELKTVPAKEILPLWENAGLPVIPDIAGFVGADTVACVLATDMDEAEELTLLVDIGTNGEMVLGNRHAMAACATAAGPALEGAGIRFGMRGQAGAIDRVHFENGKPRCSVIGGGDPVGICGSGIIDAVAAALDAGWLNSRGKILTEDGLIRLTGDITLDQEDIRQVQLAKGAIAAGIRLLADHLGVTLADIHRVYLAGAFGTYMDPHSACRIGLLPPELEPKITAVGNAAGSGAKLLPDRAERAAAIAAHTDALELASLPGFARCFAKSMRF